MKKIMNKPEKYVDEMLAGIYCAHKKDLKCVEDDLRCLVTTHKHPGKVSIATGGGSGHLPLFLGYVGEGMLDGCSVGDVFQSPSAEQMLAVTKEIDNGAGVLYIYGNYNGDIFNFDMAADMADMEEPEEPAGADMEEPEESAGQGFERVANQSAWNGTYYREDGEYITVYDTDEDYLFLSYPESNYEHMIDILQFTDAGKTQAVSATQDITSVYTLS